MKFKMKLSTAACAIIVFIVFGAYYFQLITSHSLALIMCSLAIVGFCIYFDTVKKTADNKIDRVIHGILGIIFFSYMFFLLFCQKDALYTNKFYPKNSYDKIIEETILNLSKKAGVVNVE